MIFIHVSPRTVRPQQISEAAIFLRCYFTVILHASNSTIRNHTSSCIRRSFLYIVYFKTNLIRFHTYVQARAQNVCHQHTKLYKKYASLILTIQLNNLTENSWFVLPTQWSCKRDQLVSFSKELPNSFKCLYQFKLQL